MNECENIIYEIDEITNNINKNDNTLIDKIEKIINEKRIKYKNMLNGLKFMDNEFNKHLLFLIDNLEIFINKNNEINKKIKTINDMI